MRWLSVREDLGIDNIDTCVGFAVSKNRRCRSPTPSAQKYWAHASLERISENGIQWQQLSNGHFDEYLFDELAQLLLCSRHHRDQKSSIIAGWKQRALARERDRISQEVRALETTVETITTMMERVSLAAQQPIPEPVSSSTRVSEGQASMNSPENDALDAPRPNAAPPSNRHSITPRGQYLTSNYRSNVICPSSYTEYSSIRYSTTLRGHDPGSMYLNSSHMSSPIWPYNYTTSSSNRHSNTPRGYDPGSIYLSSIYGSNLIWPHDHDAHSHQSTFLSVGHSTSPTAAANTRDSTDSKQPQPLEQVETLCPICLDSLKDTSTITSCHSCVQKFHVYCISTWLEYRHDEYTNGTCPCW